MPLRPGDLAYAPLTHTYGYIDGLLYHVDPGQALDDYTQILWTL